MFSARRAPHTRMRQGAIGSSGHASYIYGGGACRVVAVELREPGGSSSLLRTVDPDDVFNLPLYEHHLVMDLRPSREYSKGHMATAVSFPYPPLQLVASCIATYSSSISGTIVSAVSGGGEIATPHTLTKCTSILLEYSTS